MLPVCFLDDEDDEGDDEKPSKAPQPMSSSALIKLAEGGEDLVEDLELSDDDDWASRTRAHLKDALNFTDHLYDK